MLIQKSPIQLFWDTYRQECVHVDYIGTEILWGSKKCLLYGDGNTMGK